MADLSRSRLVELYFDHLRFIENSAFRYDRGDEKEALRMAVSFRVLFHQTARSTALLSHLAAFDCEMVTSEEADVVAVDWETREGSRVTRRIFSGGISLGVGQWAKHLPTKDFPRRLKASEWWNANVMQLRDKVISRRTIALWIANNDGGAHVDNLTGQYEELQSLLSSIRLDPITDTKSTCQLSPCFRLIRQSANDFIHSTELHDHVRRRGDRKSP